jgi:hypothetical protein
LFPAYFIFALRQQTALPLPMVLLGALMQGQSLLFLLAGSFLS